MRNRTKCPSDAVDNTFSVKFANKGAITDDFWLLGGTKWSRFKYRLKHPIVYSKRCFRLFYRKVKRLFVREHLRPIQGGRDEKPS